MEPNLPTSPNAGVATSLHRPPAVGGATTISNNNSAKNAVPMSELEWEATQALESQARLQDVVELLERRLEHVLRPATPSDQGHLKTEEPVTTVGKIVRQSADVNHRVADKILTLLDRLAV